MKLMICISNKKYSPNIILHLSKNGYRVTKLASTGGFLREGNDTLLIGVSNKEISQLHDEMKKAAVELEKQKGWSSDQKRYTAFVIDGHNFLPFTSA